MIDVNSIERIIPNELNLEDNISRQSLNIHVQRYKFADKILPNNIKILDLACGVGYGSNLLSRNRFVTGIDIDKDAIEYAKDQRDFSQKIFKISKNYNYYLKNMKLNSKILKKILQNDPLRKNIN